MEKWMDLLIQADSTEDIKRRASNFDAYEVYESSVQKAYDSVVFMAMHSGKKKLVVYKQGQVHSSFEGEEISIGAGKAKVCDLSIKNAEVLRRVLPFTAPVSIGSRPVSIGLGDRLGLASAGHLRLLKGLDVFPILAQQSIRELNLTGRTYPQVLADACYAVFQEGYEGGFGADGDHLKQLSEVQMALDCGFTMITLDCSEHIDNTVDAMTDAQVDEKYSQIEKQRRQYFEEKYLGKGLIAETMEISLNLEELKRIVLVYAAAADHAKNVYHSLIAPCPRRVDFEVSIDETLSCTSPAAHFFTASELIDAGVKISSMAPRFHGEFQKGIDYIGDISEFTQDFDAHCKIAKHFGYKISIHSGSDKFSIFPIVGRLAEGAYHLKTAGTNWLEAVRVIAQVNPQLYRRMHIFALSVLDEAREYYNISAKPENVADIDTLDDEQLPELMDKVDSRQLLHITYGLILHAINPDGSSMFRSDIYHTLNINESKYYAALIEHIGKHLSSLGIMP